MNRTRVGAWAVAIGMTAAIVACSPRTIGDIADLEARLDDAARQNDGRALSLADVVDEISWDRVVIVSCSEPSSTRDALGFDWSGIEHVHAVDGLCDFDREVDALLFVSGETVPGWGTVNQRDDGTWLSIELRLPAALGRDGAVFVVSPDPGCLSNCPTYRLRQP